ncbi:MAG TPA: head-tail adaptor protein [Devosia sp.]|nr:head-tail adaptor protein [Devosia sp.]
MPVNAGDLDRQITLQRYGISYNADNEPIEGYAGFATVWASWRRATARETLAGAEVNATATDIFEIYWSPEVADVDPKDRLIFDGKSYDIASVAEIGRREGLRIAAARRADA